MPEKTCEFCGKPFHTSSKRRFCCQDCRYQSRRKSVACICEHCGKEYEAAPSALALSKHHFCSQACYKAYAVGEHAPNYRGGTVERTCKCCGKMFYIKQYKSREGKGIYCSRACHDADKSISIVCPICKEPFSIPRGRKDKAVCCSIKCSAIRRSTITGSDHPLYKNHEERKCPGCGIAFYTQPSVTKVYCTHECYLKHRGHIEKVCANCGEVFIVQRFAIDTRRYCSWACYRHNGLTSIEEAISNELLLRCITFDSQYAVKPWTLDFAFPRQMLAIEADGVYWHSIPSVVEKDTRKDADLERRGWTVLHFTGDQIRESPSDCVDTILEHLHPLP